MAAKNITIAGASYPNVPSITCPVTGGGTASYVEISDTDAIASDVASGKYFYTAAGVKTAGTASGGGGGGTTISSAGDYTVNAGDTITMGTGLTGDLTAYGARVLENNWDFKSSLTDTVGGSNATLTGATRDSNGVKIASTSQYVTIPFKPTAGKMYEMDIASISKTYSSGNGRVLMWTANQGFIYRSTGVWTAYFNGAWDGLNAGSTVADLNGKTLRAVVLPVHGYAGGNTTDSLLMQYYINGTKWYCPTITTGTTGMSNITIGASANSFATMVVTGFRIYSGVHA